ncbi:hypothetical protein F4818DRAFT_441582 [Hypoxylon cercidicola]|nr:hypothetical protein F4818DRAFT_441582 [Hypoxylon cercidicola]
MDQLNVRDALEYDASLSRLDTFYGNHVFNRIMFDESRAYWTEPIIDANILANSKVTRQIKPLIQRTRSRLQSRFLALMRYLPLLSPLEAANLQLPTGP